jgi:hypothetical protein
MVRRSIAFAACVVLVAGCDRAPSGNFLKLNAPAAGLMADMAAPPPAAPGSGPQQFSYSHSWSVRMNHGAVAPRFVRARDFCLHDKALHCKLVSANIQSGDEGGYAGASLNVQLPHGALDRFEQALLAPVGGEKPGDAAMVSRSTQAQSVETEASDTARKVAQLTAYRDRLADIAKRPNLTVDDIIKIEAERGRVQGDLDDATGHQRDLTDGIARESVAIDLSERVEPVGPLTQAFRSAGSTLADSAASALLFVIAAVPWLPIVAGGIFLVSWLWRLFRRRRAAANTAA